MSGLEPRPRPRQPFFLIFLVICVSYDFHMFAKTLLFKPVNMDKLFQSLESLSWSHQHMPHDMILTYAIMRKSLWASEVGGSEFTARQAPHNLEIDSCCACMRAVYVGCRCSSNVVLRVSSRSCGGRQAFPFCLVRYVSSTDFICDLWEGEFSDLWDMPSCFVNQWFHVIFGDY